MLFDQRVDGGTEGRSARLFKQIKKDFVARVGKELLEVVVTALEFRPLFFKGERAKVEFFDPLNVMTASHALTSAESENHRPPRREVADGLLRPP